MRDLLILTINRPGVVTVFATLMFFFGYITS